MSDSGIQLDRKVTEGASNTVHYLYKINDRVVGTACNRELLTTRNRRRRSFDSQYEVTCKRCLAEIH